MSTENPDNDPFRKHGSSDRPPDEPREPPPPGSPYGGPPPPPSGGYGPHGTQGSPYGGAPGEEGPYGQDPLAGMPPLPSRGRRLLARIIDWLIVFVPVYLVAVPVAGSGYDYGDGGTSLTGTGSWVVEAVAWVLYFVYEGLMLGWRGQTVGKMALRLRVASLRDGSVPDGNAAWIRSAVYALPLIIPCFGFVFWLMNVLSCTWDRPYRQCVHDKAAKTVVVPAE
jgi:uncharacterized RDD family membrane protein YckC